MFARTHNRVPPWSVRADKRLARITLIKDLLMRLHYDDKGDAALLVDRGVVLHYRDACAQLDMFAP